MNQSERRFSNKVGEEYDLFSLALPHQDEIQIETVKTVSKHFPENINKLEILEIGFGTGITSNTLLSKDNRIYLTGIDNEPAMLEKALNKLKSFPKERYNLYTIDALEYLQKQKDESFDAIVSVWVLHNLHNDFRNQILKEIYRTLKIGGIFVNGDKLAVSDITLHKKHFDWQIKQLDVYEEMNRPELKREWMDHYIEDENPDRILYEDRFLEDLTNLGFIDCKTINRHFLDAIASAVKR